MNSILVIGMSKFGQHLSLRLAQLGNEVMIIDQYEEKISDLISDVTNAQIGDCTKIEVLKSLGVTNFDLCFVCMATNFQSSLEITSLLRELGAKHIISKASTDIHAKFLLRNGADEVVYPEKDIAERLAMRYSLNNVYEYIQISSDILIFEVPVYREWIGKSIADISVRQRYHVNILAIKDEKESLLPNPEHVLHAGDHLMVMGYKKDMERLLKIINHQ